MRKNLCCHLGDVIGLLYYFYEAAGDIEMESSSSYILIASSVGKIHLNKLNINQW